MKENITAQTKRWALVCGYAIAAVILLTGGANADRPEGFFQINPAGTYLDPGFPVPPATSIDLQGTLGAFAGDIISLKETGEFEWCGASCGCAGTGIPCSNGSCDVSCGCLGTGELCTAEQVCAAFSDGTSFIPPGPGQSPPVVTLFDGDIPEDFAAWGGWDISGRWVVMVPDGATEIVFGTCNSNSSYFGDADNDFGVLLEVYNQPIFDVIEPANMDPLDFRGALNETLSKTVMIKSRPVGTCGYTNEIRADYSKLIVNDPIAAQGLTDQGFEICFWSNQAGEHQVCPGQDFQLDVCWNVPGTLNPANSVPEPELFLGEMHFDTVVAGQDPDPLIVDLEGRARLKIEGVEVTQAIQLMHQPQFLQENGGPIVPIIEGKRAALRVHFRQFPIINEVTVEATGPFGENGASITAVRFPTSLPHCNVHTNRGNQDDCSSPKFEFEPPAGNWSINLKVKDTDDFVLENYDFNFTSQPRRDLVLRLIKVCHAEASDGSWSCGEIDQFLQSGKLNFLKSISPHRVLTQQWPDNPKLASTEVRRRLLFDDGDDDHDECIDSNNAVVSWNDPTVYACEQESWAGLVLKDLLAMQKVHSGGHSIVAYGVVRDIVDATLLSFDGAHKDGCCAAFSRSNEPGETVAHEVGHALGRNHAWTTSSGCPGGVAPNDPENWDWPFEEGVWVGAEDSNGNNGFQIGYDLRQGIALPWSYGIGGGVYDVMSYCAQQWVSKFTFEGLLSGIDLLAQKQENGSGTFWLVSGRIVDGSAQTSPIISLETSGQIDAGTGSHRIELRDTEGSVLYTRFFTPTSGILESTSSSVTLDPGFSEMIPTFSTTSAIAFVDSGGVDIGEIALGGVTPIVTILFPSGGELIAGMQTLAWSIEDPDSTAHTFWVQYSVDDGLEWETLVANWSELSLQFDFDLLGGAQSLARFRVLASDGTNTGVGVSNAFSVPSKPPTVTIVAPNDGEVWQFDSSIWFEAAAIDLDDGVMTGNAIQWESSLDGILGQGEVLHVPNLSQGSHMITVVTTDSDTNQATDTIVISVSDFDQDDDGVTDGVDNCALEPNPDQLDTNNDNIGNACDTDLNGDCLVNFGDLALLKAGFFPVNDPDADFNGDSLVNFGDLALMKSTFFNSANPGPGPGAPGNDCE